MTALRHIPALLCLGVFVFSSTQAADLSTKAERTDYAETGRYAEVQSLCKAFADAHPDQVRCFSFGTSADGRDMLVLAANPGPEGPGPIISMMAKTVGSFPIPVVVVPGDLTDSDIDGLS